MDELLECVAEMILGIVCELFREGMRRPPGIPSAAKAAIITLDLRRD